MPMYSCKSTQNSCGRVTDGPSMQVVRGTEVLVKFAVDARAIEIHRNLVSWYSWMPYWLRLGLHFGMLYQRNKM